MLRTAKASSCLRRDLFEAPKVLIAARFRSYNTIVEREKEYASKEKNEKRSYINSAGRRARS